MQRDQVIVRTSVISIGTNLLLAVFKAAVGLLSGSIAVTLDAVNNISDVLSSVITIIGTKLAGRRPDKKHPYGHGRIEYLTELIIAVIILYAGVTSMVESVKKIIDPTLPNYSTVSLLIIAVAVVVKILLGRYVKRTGERVNSDSLVASGQDAMLDSLISASTLAAAVIFLLWHVSLEAWLGAVISLVFLKSGGEMVWDTLSDILGERVESKTAGAIKQTVCSFPDVYGAYDLVLHNYGPDRFIGSVHIEIPDTYTINDLDMLERDIVGRVYEEHQVILAGISIYSRNTQDSGVQQMQKDIRKIVMAHDYVLQMHGFFLNEQEKSIRFDIIIDFAAPEREQLYQTIVQEVQQHYPAYHIAVTLDADISD